MLRQSVRTLGLLIGIASASAGATSAQPAGEGGPAADTVTWTVSTANADGVKPGGHIALVLHGAVRPGWHVYGLNQAPSGPTPLRVIVEANDAARTDGPAKGSAPVKRRDPAFDAETEFYAEAFSVTAPVLINPHVAPGRQAIPVSVRFQTCSGDICQPPKTVRLSAPVTVRGNG